MKLISKNVDKDGGGYVYQVLSTALYVFRLTVPQIQLLM
jgi:hypothetical protein